MLVGPKPQRKIADGWRQGFLIMSNVKDEMHKIAAERVLLERGAITCRECYGFGHGIKKCPTTLRIKKFAMVNKMAKHLFATYRAKSSGRKMEGEYPII